MFLAVVPLAGTWIETPFQSGQFSYPVVVPLAGTWIETFAFLIFPLVISIVVPLAGTWIETYALSLS